MLIPVTGDHGDGISIYGFIFICFNIVFVLWSCITALVSSSFHVYVSFLLA